jgi:6-phosphofructokinase 1
MKRIGVLTSGGDAPGMNAAIRSVVRTGIYYGMEVVGVLRGFEGLIQNDTIPMELCSVGDILHRGGTILKTARSEEFMTEAGMQKACETLRKLDITDLVVIGGDGSMRGSIELSKRGFSVMLVPGTIDNDMGYTDYTIGFDTAVNTVLCAISNIRDTASAHERTTIIEVMGRTCGDIALYSGVTGGAEYILIPELEVDMDSLCNKIIESIERKKSHNIIIKAEGVEFPSDEIAKIIKAKTGQEARIVVLAYLQRGGSPSCRDRMLASLMGNRAVELIYNDSGSRAIGITGNEISDSDMEMAVQMKKEAALDLLGIIDSLSK